MLECYLRRGNTKCLSLSTTHNSVFLRVYISFSALLSFTKKTIKSVLIETFIIHVKTNLKRLIFIVNDGLKPRKRRKPLKN